MTTKCEFCQGHVPDSGYIIVYKYGTAAQIGDDRPYGHASSCHEECIAGLRAVYYLIGMRFGTTRYQRVTMHDGSVIDGYS